MSHDVAVVTRTVAWPLPPPQPWPQLQSAVEQLARAIDARLTALDPAWIGHLKLLLADATQAAYLSVTYAGEPPSWNGVLRGSATGATLTVYAAVWGVSAEQLTEVIDASLASIANRVQTD